MDFYFVKREVISLIHEDRPFDITNLSYENLIILKSKIPEGNYVGDQCLFNLESTDKEIWTHSKVVWQDFDLDKYNEINNSKFLTHDFGSKYYLFTPFEGIRKDLEITFQSMSKFADDNQIELRGGLIIIPQEESKNEKEKELLELDIFIPVIGKIPKTLLKKYQPYRIRRRRYNFFTY